MSCSASSECHTCRACRSHTAACMADEIPSLQVGVPSTRLQAHPLLDAVWGACQGAYRYGCMHAEWPPQAPLLHALAEACKGMQEHPHMQLCMGLGLKVGLQGQQGCCCLSLPLQLRLRLCRTLPSPRPLAWQRKHPHMQARACCMSGVFLKATQEGGGGDQPAQM